MRRVLLSFTALSILSACGSSREVEPKAPAAPSAPSKPVDSDDDEPSQISFAEVKQVADAACLRCHQTAQFLKSEAGWRGSAAKSRTQSLNMPPPGTAEAKNLTPEDRNLLVSF